MTFSDADVLRKLTLATALLVSLTSIHWFPTSSVDAVSLPPTQLSRAYAIPSPLPLFWYKLPIQTISGYETVNAVEFDPKTPGVVLASAGFLGETLLRSSDNGRTWSILPSWNPDDRRFTYRVVYGGQKDTYYVWGGTAIYKTENAGQSWIKLPYDQNCNQIVSFAINPVQPATLFVGTTNGFARSLDGGQTWRGGGDSIVCSGGPNAATIGVGVNQPNTIYAGEFYNYRSYAVERRRYVS